MNKLSVQDKAHSDITLEIIVHCAVYGVASKNFFDSGCVGYVIKDGYIEENKNGNYQLTKKGRSLYEKLQCCVIADKEK